MPSAVSSEGRSSHIKPDIELVSTRKVLKRFALVITDTEDRNRDLNCLRIEIKKK